MKLTNQKKKKIILCSLLIIFLYPAVSHVFHGPGLSCYALLTDLISLPDCLYFLRYWSICVLQLFVNQVVTS